ncbi:unnamed protein product [Closterium sp. NIES-54]
MLRWPSPHLSNLANRIQSPSHPLVPLSPEGALVAQPSLAFHAALALAVPLPSHQPDSFPFHSVSSKFSLLPSQLSLRSQVHWWRSQALRFMLRWPSPYLCHLTNRIRHGAYGLRVATHTVQARDRSASLLRLYNDHLAAASASSLPASASSTSLRPLSLNHTDPSFLSFADPSIQLRAWSGLGVASCSGSASSPGPAPSFRTYLTSLYEGVGREAYMPRPMVSLHIRQGDKGSEMKLSSFNSFMFYMHRLRLHVPDIRFVWISTEMQSVIDQSAQFKDWTFFYSQNERQLGDMRLIDYEKKAGRAQLVGVSFANLIISSECDYYVGVLGSNWNRLINEMRATSGRVFAGYVAINNGANYMYFPCHNKCRYYSARCACVASPLLSRSVPSPLLSRPVAPAVPSRRPCCPVPSPLPSRRPWCPVPCRRPCCPVASPPAVPSRPVVPAVPPRPVVPAVPSRRPPSVPPRRAVHPVPSRPRRASRPIPSVARTPCALPVRRAPAAPCPSVAPFAPCPSAPVAPVPASHSEETHFTQVRTPSEFLTAIKARYATPTIISLGRLFLPFLFPDLASFERTADSITHLRSLDSSYRTACTDAQLALLPPPMAITIYFIATSLPDRLASVRDALLRKHPSELTIEVLELALKDVESNLRSVASASSVVPPPLFHWCTFPQLPTFTASLATAATDVTAAAVTTSSRSRGRSGRRGGQGAGRGGGGSGGDVARGGGRSAGAGGAPRAAAGDSPAAAGEGDAWCFSQLTDTVRLAYGVDGPAPDWLPLVQTYDPALWGMSASQLVDIFGIPHAMYAVVDSSASDSVYSSVVSLGASLAEVPVASVGTCVDTSPGATPEDASLSFTLDSGASHCFFRDCMTLTPLPTPVYVALANPTLGPVTARYTTTLPFPAVPSGSLTGFHVPSFSWNLVGVRPLVPASHQVAASPQVAVSGQVPVSGPVAASCSCRSLAYPTVLWHHRMGHPPISRLRAMSSQRLVLGLPRVLPLLPPSLAQPCSPCVEGRLCATPHSSSLRPANEPFETLHLDVWGPASRPGPERESFFLVVVGDYSRYTTVFPLAKKSDVNSMLIRWLLTTADTRGRRVSCLHSDHGGEFRSGILVGFCREQGIRQSWTLPQSPQQNGVAERRIGLVMEIVRTSMTQARAPHFCGPTRSPGAASRFHVWGCLALVRDTSADKISPRAVSCVFLGFPEDSSDYTFYHPPLHQFFDSRDIRFDESVPYYPPPPSPAPSGVSHATPPSSVAPQVQPPSPQSSSQPTADPAGAGFGFLFVLTSFIVNPLLSFFVLIGFCGEDPGGASSRGAGVGAESVPLRGPGSGGAGVGAELVTAGDSSLRGAGVSGAVPGGATTGGAPSAGPREPGTDPVTSGGAGSGGGASGSLESGPGATTAPDTAPPPHPYPTRHQARVRRAREEQLQLEREERELEQQQPEQEQPQQPPPPPPVSGLRTLGLPSPSPPSPPSPPVSGPPLPPPDPSPAVFPPPLPPLSPPLSHTWPSRCSPRARPSSRVPFTDLRIALFNSSPPYLSPYVLPSPPELALTASLSTPVTDYYHTYRPVLSRVLASLVTDSRASLSFVSALTAAVTEFASTRCLDYATSLVAAPPTSPLAIGGESALGCDALEDRQFELEFLAAASPHLCAMLLAPEGDPDALYIPTPRTYAEAVPGPWASQWRAAMDSEMASYRSTGTYVDEVPPLKRT